MKYQKKQLRFLSLRFLSIILLAALFICGCGKSDDKKLTYSKGDTITGIEVFTAADNEKGITSISYPTGYYCTTSETDFDSYTALEDLSQEDTEYFINYIGKLSSPKYMKDIEWPGSSCHRLYGDHTYYCSLHITYTDASGEEQSKFVHVFDEYPEGYSDFVDKFNEICGGDYLTDSTDIKKVTADYITDMTGYTDDDVEGGTIDDVIELTHMDMFDVILGASLNNFSTYAENYELYSLRPQETQKVASNKKDFVAFVEKFFTENGDDISYISYNEDSTTAFLWTDQGWTKIFRTDRFEKSSTDMEYVEYTDETGFTYYKYTESGTTLNGSEVDLYYSADGKYGLATNATDVDYIKRFCQLEL